MLKNIQIANFRCLEQTQIKGFSNINLIGGKNNIGKTALLEALLLYIMPQTNAILELRANRQESKQFIQKIPKRTVWDNFFYQPEDSILLTGEDQDNYYKNVAINIINSQTIPANIPPEYYHKFLEILSQNSGQIYPLEIQVTADNYHQTSLIIDTITSANLELNIQNAEIPFLYCNQIISNEKLTQLYDQARLNDQDHIVLNILKIVDPSLEAIESFSLGQPTIFLKQKNKKRLPISLFGDAINRITMIILKLINNQQKILLIDEIENGLHYSIYQELWHKLFSLCQEMNVQIFATTHSLEMIQSFAAVGLQNDENQKMSAYFELTKHCKTQQVIGIKRDLDTLDYAIEYTKGVRGE
jgi:AAA15 family ATPase/GTPase